MCYVYLRLALSIVYNFCTVWSYLTCNSHVFLIRRRLPIIMVKLRMAQAVKDAVKYIEQGHILPYESTNVTFVTIKKKGTTYCNCSLLHQLVPWFVRE